MKNTLLLITIIFSQILLAQSNDFPATANAKSDYSVRYFDFTTQEYQDLIKIGYDCTYGKAETNTKINLKKAIATLTEAIRIYPNVFNAYLCRGRAYQLDNNMTLAKQDLEKVKVISPSSKSIVENTYKEWEEKLHPTQKKTAIVSVTENNTEKTINQAKPDAVILSNQTINYTNGDRYIGQLTNGKQTGKGEYTFENGNVYTGDFVEGDFKGKGILKWVFNGNTYTGDFESYSPNGFGTYRFFNGETLTGQFKNTSLEGEGIRTLVCGYTMKGVFKASKPVEVKCYNTKNQEITPAAYNEVAIKEWEKRIPYKDSRLVYNITIPDANGSNFLTHRFGYPNGIITQFSSDLSDMLYILDDTPGYDYRGYNNKANDYITVYNDSKLMGRMGFNGVATTEVGKIITADINRASTYANGNSEQDKKSIGYMDRKFRIKTNNDAPFDLINNESCTLSLFNYQENKEEVVIENFSFWNNKEEKNEYYRTLKTDFYKWSDKGNIKKSEVKNVFTKDPAMLTDVRASYNADKSIAHVVFTFKHPYIFGQQYLLYDIDFKNKTYKKVGESKFGATINDDHYVLTVSDIWDEKVRERYKYQKLITFDDNNTVIELDADFYNRINKMNEYDDEIQFLTSNKDFIIFKCWNQEIKNKFFGSYYFVNKNNKECEKIVNLHLPYDPNHYYSLKNHVLIWNKDLTKSAVTMTYRLNPTDENYVSCIYMIDWNTMTKTLLNDSKYQLAARQNDQIIQDKKEEERRADNAKYEENERLRAIARAIGHKCSACNGSGKGISTMEVSGTTPSTTITNNVNFNWSQTVGGSSTYSSTQHACPVCGGSGVVHD